MWESHEDAKERFTAETQRTQRNAEDKWIEFVERSFSVLL
jgi:hypothetical protein